MNDPRRTRPWLDAELARATCCDSTGAELWTLPVCYTAHPGQGITIVQLPGRLSIPTDALALFGITIAPPKMIRVDHYS